MTWHASPCSQQPPRATHQSLLMATLASNRHPKATHQWLLMGIQVCRLPALKPLKRSKPLKGSKRLKLSKALKTVKPNVALACFTLQPTATPRSQQPPRATHQSLLMATLASNRFLWLLLHPTATPRPHINGFLWASKSAVCQLSCSQQAPQGHTSMASYGHSCSQQAPQSHTSTHQWLLMGIQVCRLPALLQPTGTPAPHIHRSLWPLLHPTATSRPHINGFLWASKSAVCQP